MGEFTETFPLESYQISSLSSDVYRFSQFTQIADKYGRKAALISCAVPQMAGWILIYFARNPIYLIISRFVHGFAGGGKYEPDEDDDVHHSNDVKFQAWCGGPWEVFF